MSGVSIEGVIAVMEHYKNGGSVWLYENRPDFHYWACVEGEFT